MTHISLASGPRLCNADAARSERERRRFGGAMALSATGHALIIALLVLLWRPQELEITTPPIPVTLVQEKVGQSGAMGGGSDTTAASGSGAAEASTTSAESAPATAPEAPPEQPAQQAETPPEPQPEQPPRQAETPPPEPSPPEPSFAQQSVTPAPAPPEEIEPVPVHKPVPPHPKPPTHTAAREAAPKAVAPPTPQPAPAPTASSQTATAAPSSTLPEGLGGQGRGEQGAGRAAVGNGALQGPGDDYLDAVRRWVTKFRKYPDEAVKQKQEGTVMLGFKFTRDGAVLDAWIERSSGFPLLDQAALQMIHSASPIPKVPDRYKGDTLTLVMPENFRIGLFDRLFH